MLGNSNGYDSVSFCYVFSFILNPWPFVSLLAFQCLLCVFPFITSPVIFPPHSSHPFLILSLGCLYIVFVLPLVFVSLFRDVPFSVFLFLVTPSWCVVPHVSLLVCFECCFFFALHFLSLLVATPSLFPALATTHLFPLIPECELQPDIYPALTHCCGNRPSYVR